MKRYRAFDLLVEKSGRSYRARVLGSPAGEGDAKLPRPLAADMERLAAALASPSGSPSRKLAEELGGKLFRAVFAGEVGRRFAASHNEAVSCAEGLRLRLHLGNAPRLSLWPWEYLYDPALQRFLALSAETPIVRYLSLPERTSPLETRLPLSVLVAVATPGDRSRLQADRELGRIERELAPLRKRGQVALDVLRPATLAALGERLRRSPVHVLHFIGHGAFDTDRGEGLLLLEDEKGRSSPVSGQRLGATLLGRELRLVVLNACEGARHGLGDAFGGVAQTLLQQRIPAVVAMQVAITDRAAATFAQRFYGALAAGEPVDAAVAEARLAMHEVHRGLEWGAPVLYLRSQDGVLFALGAADGLGAEGPPAAPPPGVRPARARELLPWVSIAAALLLLGGLAFLVHNGRQPTGAERAAGPSLAPVAAVPPVHGTSEASVLGRAAPRTSSPAAPPERAPAPRRPSPASPAVPRSPSCPSPDSPEIDFVLIPSGQFQIGSAHGGKPNERPAHTVTISKPFCLGAYEITTEAWDAVMGDGKAATTRREELMPKVGITWDDAQRFVERLNARNPGRHFFLPSEAQWEYAARAGSAASYSFGDNPDELPKYGNCRSKEPRSDHYDGLAPIGTFERNAWGLYDMQGNVWEWVEDRYGNYSEVPATDPSGPSDGNTRVRRGGAWSSAPGNCRPASRVDSLPTYHRNDLGFRIAATPLQ